MKVLIVVENPAERKILQDRFQGCGFETFSAKNDGEGWKMAEDEKPNVILLDLVLASRNDFYIMTMLKQHPDLKDIPIFILSDMDDDENLNRIAQMKIEDYFIKQQCPIGDVIEKIRKKLEP